MEGALRPRQSKVFRLESVSRRQPSQKLKFIEITVFGWVFVLFCFVLFCFLREVGDVFCFGHCVTCRIPYLVLNPGPAVKLPSPKAAVHGVTKSQT